MNIPATNNNIKNRQHLESMPTHSTDRTPRHDGSAVIASTTAQKIDENRLKGVATDGFDRETLNSFIKDAEEQFEKQNIKLTFNLLEENDTIQIELVDIDGKTIRKIPDDDLVRLIRSLKNLDRGFLDTIS